MTMGFFDFLFNKSNGKNSATQPLSPLEQVVKESVEHLKKCLGSLTSEKLEAEAINLASYIFLHKGGKIDFELDFLTKGLINKVPSGDYTVADKVFPLMIKYGEGLYTEKHASFGKNQGYRLNVTKDTELTSSLKGYYKSVHKVNVGEVRLKTSSVPSNRPLDDKVDLGLPSGVLWATCNIGASSPTDAGDYFAWGEKESKDVYVWESYKLARGSYDSIFKYTEADGKSILDSQDDVATAKLGDEWRMPTKEDMEELVEECKWEWMSQNGVLGWIVTGNNGKSIFLPAVGAASSYRIAGVNELGRYWTSTRNESGYSAFNLRFKDGRETIVVVDDTRFYGRPVRAVYGKAKIVKSPQTLEPQSTTQIEMNYKLNALCEHVIRQLFSSMQEGGIYTRFDQSIHKLPNGGIRIHQEEYGQLFNNFDFLGENGWIRYVRIYGQILDGHYRTIGNSMEVFGLRVDNVIRKEDYVECIINQAQFGQ
jgi:hypothetical protein